MPKKPQKLKCLQLKFYVSSFYNKTSGHNKLNYLQKNKKQNVFATKNQKNHQYYTNHKNGENRKEKIFIQIAF